MLLKSSSSPAMKPWIIPVSNPKLLIVDSRKSRSMIMLSSSSVYHSAGSDCNVHRMKRIAHDAQFAPRNLNHRVRAMKSVALEEVKKEESRVLAADHLLSIGSGGDNGGRMRGLGGSGGYEYNREYDSTATYYQRMITSDPGNPLFAGNYARFLKEVCGDNVKAEEYCAKAVLANEEDGNVLSMYADLIWENHKDASRAEGYFDRAVMASPDNCYVLASYAYFLWDAEEEAEVVEIQPKANDRMNSPSFPLAAAT